MNFQYPHPSGRIEDGAYRKFGHVTQSDTGEMFGATIDFQFRMATNGVIVNTLVNDEPLITTSAGYF